MLVGRSSGPPAHWRWPAWMPSASEPRGPQNRRVRQTIFQGLECKNYSFHHGWKTGTITHCQSCIPARSKKFKAKATWKHLEILRCLGGSEFSWPKKGGYFEVKIESAFGGKNWWCCSSKVLLAASASLQKLQKDNESPPEWGPKRKGWWPYNPARRDWCTSIQSTVFGFHPTGPLSIYPGLNDLVDSQAHTLVRLNQKVAHKLRITC